ncbi:complex I NDUFA9 subunit family protein [Halalkalicoccus jeotgali]|uniref:NAD-dependent epimerase/dehydratase n=1 Tax=Halalkalicoccus jeotgali (strain DSM 18796 / CECT 7217 / JCM 14584 / KCTC 4019 / B3) TaxID=795797 RepID=D8J9G9_HALJB|nr:complex I NDUFA9 subunit family protein [Halalkalicoccus jeotgali]ADJ14381.1 NAD-dependent epimerase/dehydratase [Halalkalicoccus jeotgali B3]ELY40642.1 NAD-dependent epimerase/dehydratase [Halalkalicoccus jeotgali B3]
MKVLVTGGTGFIGRHLCAKLAQRGHDVTALARSPDASSLPADVAVERGDVTDRGTLDFAGQDVVVNLVALSPLFEPKGEKTHESVHLDGTRNVVDAAEAAGVSRLVQMSALGADPDGPTAYIRAKGKAERVVEASELDWTIFRPSVVFGDGGEFVEFTRKLTPPVIAPLPGGGRTRFQPIWVEDIASLLADAVEDERHVGETYEIGGPEVLTMAEVAKLSRGGGVTVVPIPMAFAKIGSAAIDPLPFIPFGTDQVRSLEFDNTTRENDLGAFGVNEADLLTLEEYLNGR